MQSLRWDLHNLVGKFNKDAFILGLFVENALNQRVERGLHHQALEFTGHLQRPFALNDYLVNDLYVLND
jgi:hypothetical protein